MKFLEKSCDHPMTQTTWQNCVMSSFPEHTRDTQMKVYKTKLELMGNSFLSPFWKGRSMSNPQTYFALSRAYSSPSTRCLPLPPVGWLNSMEAIEKTRNSRHLDLVNFVHGKWLKSRKSVERTIRRSELLYLVQLRIQLRRYGYAI